MQDAIAGSVTSRSTSGHVAEAVFRAGGLAALWFEVIFVLAVVIGLVVFTDRRSLLEAILAPEARHATRLTILTVSITTALSMLLAIPAAYVLSQRQTRLNFLVDTLLDLPIVMPPIAAGLALLILFGYYLGDPMQKLGVYLPYTKAGIVVAQFFTTMTFALRSAKAAFDSVNPRLPAVARTLGSSDWRAFRRVMLPLARNGLVAGAVLTWARCMGLFGPVVMFCGATEYRTVVLPTAIYLKNSIGDLEVAAGGTLFLMAIALVTLIIFKRLGGRGYLW